MAIRGRTGGARPVRIPLDDAEGHDLDAMAAAITAPQDHPALHPQQSDGRADHHERVQAFPQSVCSDVLVVIDEAYVEYAEAGSGRVPPELHRKLAVEAANHGVPLNKYATELLTAHEVPATGG
ncbi:UNVERIFIED_ORG: histidinol-phosphate/aromatic aminotransferase/cobyric acid decarboxylase-like protein [Arthrobacter sp. UYEF10]|uniref:toxin-antitoxin system HicB family antitoxin n=1 Tax=Pseudarthrobacter sp. S3 TaxID=3418419 RepID=UPI00339093B8